MRMQGSGAALIALTIGIPLATLGSGCSKTPSESGSAALQGTGTAVDASAQAQSGTTQPAQATALDRAEQEIRAVLNPSESAPEGDQAVTPAPERGFSVSDTEFAGHAAALDAAARALQDLQQREQTLRAVVDRFRFKADMVFGSRLKDDPLAPVWNGIKACALDLQRVRGFKDRLAAARTRISEDRRYDPQVELAVVPEVEAWVRATNQELDARLLDALELRITLRAIPLFFVRTSGECDALVREGYLTLPPTGPGHQEEIENISHRPNDRVSGAHRKQDEIAALRRKLARHAYALSVRLRPIAGPLNDHLVVEAASTPQEPPLNDVFLAPTKTKWTWPAQQLYPVCVSFDYWYAWATDERWYRGSPYRLDPNAYPKDAAQTMELWNEFKSLIQQDFAGPSNELPSSDLHDRATDIRFPKWTLGRLRKLARRPDSFAAMFESERLNRVGRAPYFGLVSTYFLTPDEVEQFEPELPPTPSAETTAQLSEADRQIDEEPGD